MAAAQHTHAFATSHHCHLCGSEISLAYASRHGESWKAHAQELRHAAPSVPRVAQALVPPGLCAHGFDGREEARLVHAACWAVVARLWGRHVFTLAELDGFLDCARDAGPFLPGIRFREAPDRLDVTIDHRLDARDMEHRPAAAARGDGGDERQWESLCAGLADEGITPPALLGLRRHELPGDVDAFVARALRQPSGGGAPGAATADAGPWAGVVGLLAPWLAGGSVAQALRNLYHGGAARFPHAANHDVVRANALTVLLRLRTIPVEDVFAAAGAPAGRRARLESPRAVPLADMAPDAPFRLRFLTLRREHYVDYLDDGGSRVGMRYLRCIDFEHRKGRGAPGDATPAVRALCGLRLFRDRVGTLAVHAKDGPRWCSVWQQDPTVRLSAAVAARPTTAEWPPGMAQGHLLVISDVSAVLCCCKKNADCGCRRSRTRPCLTSSHST